MSNLRWGLIAAFTAMIVSAGLGIISGVSLFHILIRAAVFFAVFFGFGFGLRLIINNFFPELLFTDDDSNELDNFGKTLSGGNITQDITGEYAVPELFKTPGDPDELGNIEDLVSGAFKPRPQPDEHQAIDRKEEAEYNELGDFFDVPELESQKFQEAESFEKSRSKDDEFTPTFGDDSESLGGLPDLDAMAIAFGLGFSGESPSDGFSGNSSAASLDAPSFDLGSGSDFNGLADNFAGSKGSSLGGDFESAQSGYKGNKPQPLKGDFNPKELAEGIRTVLSKDK